jgi:hypothetical protein
MTMAAETQTTGAGARPAGPPAWLIATTAALALAMLVMAVAETTLWKHFLVDRGEYVSLAGLAFVLAGGVHLYRRRRLLVSLPLILPWLLYPVVTQGDQIIDNLTINQMRLISHVLLAGIFGTPVIVCVLAARHARGLSRAQGGWLATALFAVEIWVAQRFLGTLMILTLVLMIAGALVYARLSRGAGRAGAGSERLALAALLAGVGLSLGLYLGYRNRPGAYQGSPHSFHDPSQRDAAYALDRMPLATRPAVAPPADVADAARVALAEYSDALGRVLAGYYVLDRNYNYAFHNALFLRRTPLLPEFRRVGLARIEDARGVGARADARAAAVRARLGADDPLAALVDDVREYVAFTFRRASTLERLSAAFERTPAGLQDATHLYEGEGKALGERLAEIVAKHRAAIDSPALAPLAAPLVEQSRAIRDAYRTRIVGF